MSLLNLLPLLDEVAPQPATDLPAYLIGLAMEDGVPSPGWGEVRDRLAADRDIDTDDAEALILAALEAEDARARINYEQDGWEIVVKPHAIRAVLLRYAVARLDAAGIDLEAPWLYREGDRWLVLAMVPELDAIAHDRDGRLEAWKYRHLIEHPPLTTKEN